MANQLRRRNKLGVPRVSRASFSIPAREKMVGIGLGNRISGMVGFGKVFVDRRKDLARVVKISVIQTGSEDFHDFAQQTLAAGGD